MQPGAGMHIDPKNLDASVATRFASKVHIHGFTDFVHAHHPERFLRRLRRRRGVASVAVGGALRIRPDEDRDGGQAGARGHRRLLAHAVRGLRHHHAAGADRCLWRHGIHCRALRHQVDRITGTADRHLLCGLHLLRRRGARRAGSLARVQAVAAVALHPGRTARGARHLVERAGAAAAADEARAPRAARRAWSGWCCLPAIRSISTAPPST